MGYRNQPIIEDFYGAKAGSDAMSKGIADLAAGISSWAATREAQRKIAKKENEDFGKLVGSASIRQNEIYMGLKEKSIIDKVISLFFEILTCQFLELTIKRNTFHPDIFKLSKTTAPLFKEISLSDPNPPQATPIMVLFLFNISTKV